MIAQIASMTILFGPFKAVFFLFLDYRGYVSNSIVSM